MSDGGLPYLPFFVDAWMGNSALQVLPLAARGLALQCLAEMHRGKPYGHLRQGGHVYPEKELASLLRVSAAELRRFLPMLLERGIFARDAEGAVYSPKLVRYMATRQKRAEGGRKSIEHPNTWPREPTLEGYPSTPPLKGGHNGAPKLSEAKAKKQNTVEEEASSAASLDFQRYLKNRPLLRVWASEPDGFGIPRRELLEKFLAKQAGFRTQHERLARCEQLLTSGAPGAALGLERAIGDLLCNSEPQGARRFDAYLASSLKDVARHA